MKFSFLEVLTNEYTQNQMNFLKDYAKMPEGYDEFYDKYVKPEIQQGNLSPEIEDDVLGLLSAQQRKAFQDGFKACMQMLSELIPKQAVKS